jgi:predicted DNA-binding protein (MmcQ/YjbR family)
MRKGSTTDPLHDRLLTMVLKLPGAHEDWPWGSIHCKVDGKIFVGWGRTEDGDMSVGLRVDRKLQATLVANDERFSVAKYSGKYGGVDFLIGKRPDWAEVERFVVGSYRIVAPKKRVKELDALLAGKPSRPTRR